MIKQVIMSKSSSSSSIINIHDGKPKNENVKQQLTSTKYNQSNNELTVNESDVDESDDYSLNSNNNSLSSDSNSEDIDFDVHSYQLKIESKNKNEIPKFSCDPMIYHILNDNDMYTHDPNIALNNEYYEKNIVILK